MDRRQFLVGSAAASTALCLPNQEPLFAQEGMGVTPLRAITAAADTILPADPNVPGDFKASDYGADAAIAKKLGLLGQIAAVVLLDRYAYRVATKRFIYCSDEERLEAMQAWILEKDTLPTFEKDLLSGLLSMTAIGTWEQDSAEVRDFIYESMGWYDPADPLGSFRVPCEGYSDFGYTG
ncbi:MAG: hypothetical protein QNJ97_16790 [Myxococcota bacterium]|nr:hypothetical protein [Myxococcota bacterium]